MCIISYIAESGIHLLALPWVELLLRQQQRDQPLQSHSSTARLEEAGVSNHRARVAPVLPRSSTPASRSRHVHATTQDLLIYLVQHQIILVELPSKWRVTGNHAVQVFNRQVVRVLFWRVVPWDVMQVMVHGRVLEFIGVADHSVEVSFRRGDEIGIVHEHCAR